MAQTRSSGAGIFYRFRAAERRGCLPDRISSNGSRPKGLVWRRCSCEPEDLRCLSSTSDRIRAAKQADPSEATIYSGVGISRRAEELDGREFVELCRIVPRRVAALGRRSADKETRDRRTYS